MTTITVLWFWAFIFGQPMITTFSFSHPALCEEWARSNATTLHYAQVLSPCSPVR